MFQKRKKLFLLLCFCLTFSISKLSFAQYFGNNAFQLPIVGWMGLDTTAGWAVNPDLKRPWQSSDQLQLGFGYMRNLMRGYRLWYTVQTGVGFGYAANYEQMPSRVIVAINVASGLRYNFLVKRHRPFIVGQGEYLHFFNVGVGSGHAFWLGILLGPGYEWIFANNMGLQVETGAHVLFDFLNPARLSWTAKLSYVLYF